jgi:hypothetical protein
MDIFNLTPTASTYEDGAVVNNLISKTWVERYDLPGEFTFVSLPTDKIMDHLAIGTLISHTNTQNIMMVEDHEIKEAKGSAPQLIITGRSLDAFLDHRVATDDDQGFSAPYADDFSAKPYEFAAVNSWTQCLRLIRNQIDETYVERPNFAIPNILVQETVTDTEVVERREIKRGPLLAAVNTLLKEFDGGLKIERPVKGTHAKLYFTIYQGVDRHTTVQFSHSAGDIETARYFWSSRRYKNTAYIANRYQGDFVTKDNTAGTTGLNKRVTRIEANDININPQAGGWGAIALAADLEQMLERRAKNALKKLKNTDLVEATVSVTNRYKFREDYDIGDLVWVRGNYRQSSIMRVAEYIEIDDASGNSGYPTLEKP